MTVMMAWPEDGEESDASTDSGAMIKVAKKAAEQTT
jgi:hypothetical protein